MCLVVVAFCLLKQLNVGSSVQKRKKKTSDTSHLKRKGRVFSNGFPPLKVIVQSQPFIAVI